MPAAKPWKLRQLRGDRKELVLSGWSAPFGRRRHDAMVKIVWKARTQKRYYAGGAITRHVFGERWEPWDLKGRFMDLEGGRGYALDKAKQVLDFVRDEQEISIAWGDLLVFTGFVDEYSYAPEAETDLAWELKVDIDRNEDTQPPRGFEPLNARNKLGQILANLKDLKSLDEFPQLPGTLFDLLSVPMDALTAATGDLVRAAERIQSVERATFAELQRMRGAVGQVRTAVIVLRSTAASVGPDAWSVSRSFDGDSVSGGLFAAIDLNTLAALAAAADLDRQVEIAERGQFSTSYLARSGDSWELISRKIFGAPDQADAIRQANNVRHGEAPQAGRRYRIPHAI